MSRTCPDRAVSFSCSTSQARAPRFDERWQLPADRDGNVRGKWDLHPAKAGNTESRIWGNAKIANQKKSWKPEASKRSRDRNVEDYGRGRDPSGAVRKTAWLGSRLQCEVGGAWRGGATAAVPRSLVGLLGCI